MKVIAAYSHKGGTGKSTALMLLASAIEARGQSALLVDCDPQRNFNMYRLQSEEIGCWSERLEVRYLDFEATGIADLESGLMAAEDSGRFDYALLNLAGVDHPFNREALRYAELTLLPFKPAATELSELGPALEVIRNLEAEREVGAARVLFTMMRPKLTVAASAYRDAALDGFPVMETRLRDTAIFADIVMRGLLGRAIASTEAQASGLEKMQVKRLREALDDCQMLLAEVDAIIAAEGRQA
ncbi:ParA family protein [Xinfangfangia sp. D13-10-4-6]|uniref:ParA family protein n=1 Tax=Pseudogemmobacter hezensis TaxID=2737662 RepID=UPI001553C02D|nr:ParA family protein [Pseudogemmobacter hezensis]NPD15055.1 ParA family protein [Pseudogemmobacter hezensis]